MKSVRTNLHSMNNYEFRRFLDFYGLEKIKIGYYNSDKPILYSMQYICYLYNDKDHKLEEIILVLTLTHGSMEDAFREFKNRIQ